MYFKHENGNIVEINSENLLNILVREGFVEMTEEEITEYKKPKKQKKEE